MKLFEPGKDVQLSIGGPTMVIKAYDKSKSPFVTCQWFDGPQLQEAEFAPESLIAATGTKLANAKDASSK